MNIMKNKAQSILEYALMVGIITAAIVAMALFIQRSVKSNVNVMQNQVEEAKSVTP